MSPLVSGIPRVAGRFPSSSVLEQESGLQSFLWLNNIPLYGYTFFCGFESGVPIRQPGGTEGRVMVVEDCDEGAGPSERCSELPGGQCEKGKQVGLISLMQGLSAWAAVRCWADRSLL